MCGRNHAVFAAALWILSLVCVKGDYTLEILINSYSNPGNRAVRWNGGCCDDVECEDSGCENQFHFTAQSLSNGAAQIGSAVIPSTHTGYRDNAVDDLYVSIQSSGQWPGGAQIDIQVIDIDFSSPDDLVDTFAINAILPGQNGYTTATTYNSENGYATIRLQFRVVCAANYYTQDCDTFCMAQDNEMGHYTCDGQGNRVCLEGFNGSNCNEAVSSQLQLEATSAHLISPTTQLPDSTFTPMITASTSMPPESQLTVDLSRHLVLVIPTHSADLSSHLVPAPSNADLSSHLVPAPSNADYSSHLVPAPSNADYSSHLVLPTQTFSGPSSKPTSSTPNLDNISSISTIVWGAGAGVGGSVILLSLCTGVLSCVLCRKWCKCTRHRADIKVNHEDNSVVMTRFTGMSTNQVYTSASTDYVRMKTYRDPASTEDDLYIQLKENKLQFIPREMIEVRLPLGKGHFGVVDRGIWNDPSGMIFEVALKSVKPGASQEERVKLLQEAAIMAQFKHPNVLQSYGVVAQPDLVILVLEICHSGDLKKYLKSTYDSSSSLDNDLPNQLLNFSRDVAMGMCYLSCMGFIHRDLAARNILVTAGKTCKIGDFGMSRDLMKFDGTYYISTSVLVPVKWTAPEAITDRKYSTASDVWSYGCLLYEIWSLGRDPYENIPTSDVLGMIQSGYRDTPPPGCQGRIYQLMTECWQLDRHSRPSFRDVVSVILQKDSQTQLPPTQPPRIPQKPQKRRNMYDSASKMIHPLAPAPQDGGDVYYSTPEVMCTSANESQAGEDVYYSIPETIRTPTDYYNTSTYSKLNRSWW